MGTKDLGFESWLCPVCLSFPPLGESFINALTFEAERATLRFSTAWGSAPLTLALFKGQLCLQEQLETHSVEWGRQDAEQWIEEATVCEKRVSGIFIYHWEHFLYQGCGIQQWTEQVVVPRRLQGNGETQTVHMKTGYIPGGAKI